MLLKCKVCAEMIEIKRIVLHMKFVHNSHGVISIYKCTNAACNRSFNNQRSFRRHILTHMDTSKCIEQTIRHNNIDLQFDAEVMPDTTEFVSEDSAVPNLPSEGELMTNILSSISKFYADARLSRVQTQRVVTVLRKFMDNEYTRAGIELVLNSITDETIKDIVSTAIGNIQQVFSRVDTEYKRLRELKLLGVYIEPQHILLGYMETRSRTGVLENTKRCCQYVPLSQTLKAFFELPYCLEQIHEYYTQLDKNKSVFGVISNVVQTDFWKEKTSRAKGLTFPLILYQDDFEVGNPLGSHSGIHKISALYATLPVLPTEFRSQVDKIFLVQLCHSDDVKHFGKEVVYKKVIEELNLLASKGIEIRIKNKTSTVYFQLILITGDNLGLNSMLGYVECFNATHFCRMCTVSRNTSRSLCVEKRSAFRTRINYEADVAKNNVYLTGIKEKCVWNSVMNFHCAENWSVDAMHDELDGLCGHELTPILQLFILVKKYFTLEELNFRIEYFKFPSNVNVPPLISHHNLKTKLKMSASETKCFFLYLGLLIGHLVPQDKNPHWDLYKLLRQIVVVSLQTVISPDHIDLLSALLEEHHSLYLTLFGDTLKPKHHFMLHYPSVMRLVGPIRHIWSMRCEAKHQILKQIASVSASRVNICRTIAIKSQLRFAHMLLQGNPFVVNITYRPLKKLSSTATCMKRSVNSKYYQEVKSVSFASSTYKSGDVLEIDFDELPEFGQIEHVLLKSEILVKPGGNDFAVIVKIFQVIGRIDHVQSYAVEDTRTYRFVKLDLMEPLKSTVVVTRSKGELYAPYD